VPTITTTAPAAAGVWHYGRGGARDAEQERAEHHHDSHGPWLGGSVAFGRQLKADPALVLDELGPGALIRGEYLCEHGSRRCHSLNSIGLIDLVGQEGVDPLL
jgi:hypothetical protein